METVLIVIHLIVVLAMAAVILLQRSEGGALGMGGGGGGGGGFMSGRGSGNALTKITTFLAIGFFATSIGLGILANFNTGPSIIDGVNSGTTGPAIGGGEGGLLDDLGGLPSEEPAQDTGPQAPTGQ